MIAPPVTTSAYDREDDTGAAMDGLGGGFDRVFLICLVPVLANRAQRPLVGRKTLPGPMIFRIFL
jgi:hypothetical protein